MNTIQDFINDYYNLDDIFYIGFKCRETDKWYHKSFSINTINYKSLKGQNYYKKDIYLSLNTFKDKEKGRFEHNVLKTDSVFFDIDKEGNETVKKIINELGEPYYYLQTSPEKFQLIYKLDKSYPADEIKLLTFNLTKIYNTDHTFDLARVFRAPFYINNKNGFKVKIEKRGKVYTYQELKKIFIKNNYEFIENIQSKRKQPKQTLKAIKDNKQILKVIKDNKYFNPKNKYYQQYLKTLDKVDGDNSRADLQFIRYLLYKKISFENAINILFQVRENIFDKHNNEIDYYINNIKNKCYDLIK